MNPVPRPAAASLVALCRALGLGGAPEQVLAAVDRVYRRVDAEVRRRTQGLGLPCRPGCDACCHEAVFVAAPEFLFVSAYLVENTTGQQRKAVVEAMSAVAGRFEDELCLLEALPPGTERDEVATRVRFRCPLLSASGQCSVYPARELNARTFGSTVDEHRDAPFGCELTHERLRVLPSSASRGLLGAREARRWLRDEVPGAGDVHVYPWWFSRFGAYLLPERAAEDEGCR